MPEQSTGEYIDRCRAEVLTFVARLQQRSSSVLETALHRSLSTLLREQVRRLHYHNSASVILPADLHTRIGAWKQQANWSEQNHVVGMRASQWRNALLELLRRLDTDRRILADTLGVAADAALVEISEPLSDPHNGGRSVFKLTFENGCALIYKPRSVLPEHAFQRTAEWLGRQGCEPLLATCEVLPRNGYGWASFVYPEPCRTDAQTQAYYERQGAFLALFFALRGGDCTAANLVVHRDNPVWVDTECVCTPELAVPTGEPDISMSDSTLPNWMRQSVLNTHMVHYPGVMNGNFGLTGLGVSCSADRSSVFSASGVLNNQYIKSVTSGFRSLSGWLLEHKPLLLAPGGPLSWWRGCPIRVTLKPTILYGSLMDAALVVPRTEMDQFQQDLVATLREHTEQSVWADTLIQAEADILIRSDIPHWSASTDAHDLLEASGAVISCAIHRCGFECTCERVSRLDQGEVDNQTWIIDTFLRLGPSS